MSKPSTYFSTTIPIIRNNFQETNSAKFKGNISIVSNQYGIIMDWKICFNEVWIDQFSTPAWFATKPSIFKHREKLFKLLYLTQKPRPTQTSNDLVRLSSEQLAILNGFLNNRKMYKSTIKMIVGILKGNNPGGEAKNPNSAEMVIDSNETQLKNFVILLDDLMFKYNDNFDSLNAWAIEISLEEFANLNPTIKKTFDFMQKHKSQTDFQIYLENIKKYYMEYNDFAKRGEKIAQDAYKLYSNNIDSMYSNSNLPFGFTSKVQYQKCHICEYHILRNKIVEALYNDDKNLAVRHAQMISDPENFIPLPEEIHRQFDNDLFTYKIDGIIYAINEKGHAYIENYVNSKYKHIPEWFMTPKRKKYFDMRNQNIIF